MRLLHVVPTYLPAVRYGGPIWAVHGLARALARRGHEVTVFTTNVDGSGDSRVPLEEPVERDGVRVVYFPSRHLRRLFWSPRMGHALRKAVPDHDLVHLHSIFLWPTWAAARTARAWGRPYLLAPRGMLSRELIRRRGSLRKRAWISLIERRNLERAAGVHATSPLEAAAIEAFGFRLRRVVVVPNGVDTPGPRRMPSPPPGRQIVFLGRVSWKKGLDRLTAALPLIPRATLVVAGNDEEGLIPGLVLLAQSLGVSDRVRFVGPVFGEDKARLLESSAVFVLPSLGENFGNAVLEAMAHGVPVVVTPEVGLAPDVAASGAGCVVEGHPDSLARRIADLLERPDERERMGENGRRVAVERFSWDAAARTLEAAMREIVSERAVARAPSPSVRSRE